MSRFDLGITLIIVAILTWNTASRWQRARRLRYLRDTPLPPGLFDKLRRQRPDIGPEHRPAIEVALRDFFAAYLLGGRKPVSMPSQAADELWHAFILCTRHYDAFCRQAFGRFLHHTPAVVLTRHHDRNAGLRRVWTQTCRMDGIDPKRPTRLPLLFALDAQVGLADGFRYTLDCSALREPGAAGDAGSGQCASDFASDGFDGTTDGLGDDGCSGDGGSDGCSGDGGGDGGGCGGD